MNKCNWASICLLVFKTSQTLGLSNKNRNADHDTTVFNDTPLKYLVIYSLQPVVFTIFLVSFSSVIVSRGKHILV